MGQKVGHWVQRLKNLVASHFLSDIHETCFGEFLVEFESAHFCSNTRSLGQGIEKNVNRGHIFYQISIELDQTFCLDKILNVFESGSSEAKI